MTTKLKPGTMFADRYQILECLGKGGMGTVYSAQHCALAKKFAIKLLHKDLCVNNNALTRFAQEARSASAIEHQNIIDVLDAGRINNIAFYVMEHLKGENLQTTFGRESPLPWERLERMVLQICDAMQAAHDRRIIHRDLKPSNLYRITRGNNADFIKILDFGIAKVRTIDDKTRDGLTAVGSIIGTLKYMAPEQAKGIKVDHRADIYSLGVIMYHALTGKLPINATQPAELIQRLLHDPPTPMREYVDGISPSVEALILKALSKDPADRFPSMHALASTIERLRPSEHPAPRRITLNRGPLIDLDDSCSVEVEPDHPFPEIGPEHTTLVRTPRQATRGGDTGRRRHGMHRPVARSIPAKEAHTPDAVATQTGARNAKRQSLRAFSQWASAMVIAGLITFQLRGDSRGPVESTPRVAMNNDIQTVDDSPTTPTKPTTPTYDVSHHPQAPTITPTLAVLETPPPDTSTRSPDGVPAYKEEGRRARKRIEPESKKEPVPPAAPELDCQTIRKNTLDAEADGAWKRLFTLAGSPCWEGNATALEWMVKAKQETNQFAECIKLGKDSPNPRIVKMVSLCEARERMQRRSDIESSVL